MTDDVECEECGSMNVDEMHGGVYGCHECFCVFAIETKRAAPPPRPKVRKFRPNRDDY